ncbi:MAG: hypothetical protein H6753_03775 [Candidatus Omnitrophica bacterium]|nr:hypothetical protein [Candidatus Omnitrophota bacterium]
MNLYQNNAFRVLGLLTNVTTAEIMARANEINVKKSVDFDGGYEYDFPWLGPLDRSEENITSAVQRLEDPVRRIKQELSWFWLHSESDRQAIKALTNRQFKSAFETWVKASGLTIDQLSDKEISPLTTPDALTALHNLFVLFQATLLRNELKAPEDQSIVLLEASAQSEKNWEVALRIFNFLHNKEQFWSLVQLRIAGMQDRRVQNISLDEIKESALNNALSAHFFLITKALSAKNLSMLDKHIEILENANMPMDLYKSGLNLVLNSRIANINSLCEEFVRERKVAEDKGDGALYKSLFYKYRDSGQSLIEDCKIVDRKGMTDFVVTREKYAKSFHQLSWKLNKCGDALGALESMGEAYKNLYSDALKMECEKDAERIMQDAVEQYSNAVTKMISPLQGQVPLEKVIDSKAQYLDQVRSVFSMGEVFMTDKLQSLLRELVAKELKLISVEVHNKYQAYEHAQSIMKEAIGWAEEAKNDSFKEELEAIKRQWVKDVVAPQEAAAVEAKAKSMPIVPWAVALGICIVVIVVMNNGVKTSPQIPVPPVAVNTSVSSSAEDPLHSNTTQSTQPTAVINSPSGLMKAATVAAVVTPAVLPASSAQAEVVSDSGIMVPVEMPLSAVDKELLAEASKVKAEIIQHKEKVRTMEEELNLRKREIDVRQASIDRLDNKIGTNPDSPEYNFWVNEHNDLVREQNQALEMSKEMYKDYQIEFKRQQDLITSYNERFAR